MQRRKIGRRSVCLSTPLNSSFKRRKLRLELVCLAVEQEREGKTSVAEFIANKGTKAVDGALAIAKEFGEAEAKLARSKKTRV